MPTTPRGHLSRSSQFEEYLKATNAGEPSSAEHSTTSLHCDANSTFSSKARNISFDSLKSVAAAITSFFRDDCMTFLGVYWAYTLRCGWSAYNTHTSIIYLNSVGISCENYFGTKQQLECLTVIVVVLFCTFATVGVFPLRYHIFITLLLALPALFGYASAHLLCSQSRIATRISYLVQTYVSVIKKLQLIQSGKTLLHPLPPVNRLEEILLSRDGPNSPGLAMKPLRVALATALADLEVSLLSYCNSTNCEEEVLFAHLQCADYPEGDITTVSVKSIMTKCEYLLTTMLPVIIKSRTSPWTAGPQKQPASDQGSSGRSGALCSLLNLKCKSVFADNLVPMFTSGVDLFTLHSRLRVFEQALEEMMPADVLGLSCAGRPSAPAAVSYSVAPADTEWETVGDTIANGVPVIGGDGDGDSDSESPPCPSPPPSVLAASTYGELRRQIATSRAAAEDLLLRLWRCEQQLAAGAPALLIAGDTDTSTSDCRSQLPGSISNSSAASRDVHREHACSNLLVAMELLAGRGITGETHPDGVTTAASDLSESNMQDIMAGARLTDITPNDTLHILELLRRCVELLQIQGRGGETQLSDSTQQRGVGDSDDDVFRKESTLMDNAVLKDSGQFIENKTEYTTDSFAHDEGRMSGRAARSESESETAGGAVDVITGQVLSTEQIRRHEAASRASSTTEEALSKRALQEASRQQRRYLMTELNDQIVILKATEVMRERERVLPAPDSCEDFAQETSVKSTNGFDDTIRPPVSTRDTAVEECGSSGTAGGPIACVENESPGGGRGDTGAWRGLLRHELSSLTSDLLKEKHVRNTFIEFVGEDADSVEDDGKDDNVDDNKEDNNGGDDTILLVTVMADDNSDDSDAEGQRARVLRVAGGN